jgi:chromosome segregation ATPase
MRYFFPLLAGLLLIAGAARAQDTPEDRLRGALRQSVTEMRAAQDQAAQLQAQLTQAQTDLAAMKAKFDADEAKIAQLAGSVKPSDIKAMQSQIDAAKAENDSLRQGLAKYQDVVQQDAQAVGVARDTAKQAAAGLKANTQALETCKATNKKLIDVAEQVLHLYQDHSFLWVLRKSYEPIIGAAKVDLENTVQDYDDKIRDQEYVPPPALSKK